jgi:mono/diheme cytochrome c family protein
LILLLVSGCNAASAAESKDQAAKGAFFEKSVRPLLVEHCQHCHGPDMQEAGLRLDSLDAMLTGGDSGPAIVPGNVQDSLLADAIRYGDTVQMPPNDQLGKQQIDILIQWIEDGAVWPKKKAAKHE